ncbi:MAG: hypothetical protein QW067_09220 [Thermofilaceae archaeon]
MYESVYRVLLGRVVGGRGMERCYAYVLLLQLRNGLCLTDALRAYSLIIRTGVSSVELVLASGRRRVVVAPEGVEVPVCLELLGDVRRVADRVRKYARSLGLSVRGLRRAFVDFMLRRGFQLEDVARVLGYSNPSVLRRRLARGSEDLSVV